MPDFVADERDHRYRCHHPVPGDESTSGLVQQARAARDTPPVTSLERT